MPTEASRLLPDEEKGQVHWWLTPREEKSWWRLYFPGAFPIVCFCWVAAGVLIAQQYEGWDFLTSLYVITQVVTTIGYGDITVSTPAAKIFCAFYVAGTLVLIGTALTELADSFISTNTEYLKRKIRDLEKRLGHEPRVDGQKFSKVNQAIASFFLFAFFVGFGTIFYALYEPCSCSYGPSAVEGCIDGSHAVEMPNLSWADAKALEKKCVETGGVVLTWVDAFYMSVITLTTIGFGDHSPKTQVGRAVGIVWMVLGVVACGTFVSTVGALLLERKKEECRIKRMSSAIFKRVDADGNGELSMVEFRTYVLLKFGFMTAQELEHIDLMFKLIDKDGNGSLSYAEIQEHCDQQAEVEAHF